MENEFPPNSHSRKEVRPKREIAEQPREKKEVVRITKSKAVLRKKPLHKKFFEAFRPEDNVGLVEYALLEILAPGIKDAMHDAAGGGIDFLFGGGRNRQRRSRSSDHGGHTTYNRMSTSSRGRERDTRREEPRGRSSRDARIADDVREVVLDTRVEAEEVLDSLIELTSMYDFATMRDLLRLIGEPSNPVHNDWGWTDLRGARIHRVGRDGFLLDLPRPEPLD